MSKPEWGEKRECPECGARFYDLRRDPVICPKCGKSYVVTVDRTPVVAPGQSAEDDAKEVAAESGKGVGPATEDDAGELTNIGIDDEEDEEEDDDLIEDAAELVKEDDVADVLDGTIDESKTAE